MAIALRVFILIITILLNKWYQQLNHWIMLELLWTVFPVLILIILGCPSLKLLYLQELFQFSNLLSLKISGFQWYWEYDFLEWNLSYKRFSKLVRRFFRIGEADKIILPIKTNLRILITSNDVIHAWALPSLGIKVDANPGRLNFVNIIISNPRVFIGQCSELCGNFHSWIPIFLEFIRLSLFLEWCQVLKYQLRLIRP